MLRREGRGQSLVEFALVAPLFFMVIFGIIVLGLGVFYQQQVAHAAREAARFAVVNSGSAQCPTVSNRPPDAAVVASSYWPCDPPVTRWPRMTAHARAAIFGFPSSSLHVSACWSGYWTKDTALAWADWDASPRDLGTGAPNFYRPCTIGGIDPRTAASNLPCPAPITTLADDMASSYVSSTGANTNQVTAYACYAWAPPLAGFLLIPDSITLRAVVTEALEYQQ